jgi:hypothetical protein
MTTNTASPLATAQWNTGNRYSAQGQRIVARQNADGSVTFRDLARGIDGTLTEKSGLEGADPGGVRIFPTLSADGIRQAVTTSYINGYSYKGCWDARDLKWEEPAASIEDLYRSGVLR